MPIVLAVICLKVSPCQLFGWCRLVCRRIVKAREEGQRRPHDDLQPDQNEDGSDKN